jgi:hypothetical protein
MLQLQLYQHKFFYFNNIGTVVGLTPFSSFSFICVLFE